MKITQDEAHAVAAAILAAEPSSGGMLPRLPHPIYASVRLFLEGLVSNSALNECPVFSDVSDVSVLVDLAFTYEIEFTDDEWVDLKLIVAAGSEIEELDKAIHDDELEELDKAIHEDE